MEKEKSLTVSSGIEALAMVVAGQYQELKDLRGVNDEYRQLKDQYDNLMHDYHETERCRSEWAKMFEKCSAEKEELQIKTAEVENENDELKQEIETLKSDTQVKAVFDKETIKKILHFSNAKDTKPEHGQVCLCCMTERSCIVSPQDFVVLCYNNNTEYWDCYDADVDDPDHDYGAFYYGDYKVKSWLPISKIIEYLI